MAGRRASWLIEVVTLANRHSSDIEHKHTNIKGSKQGKRKTYYPSFSLSQVSSRPIHLENDNAPFRKSRHFSSSRVLVSDNCKKTLTD